MSQMNIKKDWYLATSKPRQESRAVENLLNQGITAYSPQLNVEKIRAGKKVIVSEAMFSGYVFIQLSPEDGLWHKVKSTRGIRDWVRFSTNLAKLPCNLVEQLIKQDNLDSKVMVKKIYTPGELVRVLSGPFEGLKGIYQAGSGEERAMILIDFLGSSNRVSLENNQITSD
jgi:transcriptional antiterminator RfaH